jgi:HAD superfamily hydrolase (TIGR01450 family)
MTRPARPQASDTPLSAAYDAALLDLDGVVYVGGTPIPGAAPALKDAVAAGMKLAYVTNNASRTPSAIAGQLTGMGVPASAADVVTSAQAAARVLAEKLPAGTPVLVVGGAGLHQAVAGRGLRPVTSALASPQAVVQGYGPGIDYGLLAEAAHAINAGAWYVLTNADPTLPTPRGPAPGNGSLAQILINATGVRPVVAGKPQPPLHTESVQRVGAQRPLVVGDRMDTDIEGAWNGGADSLLVLTGVTTPAELLLAPRQHQPTYVSADLAGLNQSHRAVTADGGQFRCGGWTAAARTGEAWLAVTGSGEWIDGLRALCGAAWAAGPPPGSESEQLRAAEDVLAALGSPGGGHSMAGA